MASLIRVAVNVARPQMARAAVASTAIQQRNLSWTLPKSNLLASKTGNLGTGLLGGALAAYLISKEIIVLHYESVVVLSMGTVTYLAIKKAGGGIGDMLDDHSKGIYTTLKESRTKRMAQIEADIAEQKAVPSMLEGLGEFFNVNREINDIAREIEFRTHKQEAYSAAIKELNGVIKLEASERAREQADLVNALEAAVLAGLKGQEGAILKQCIADIEKLSLAK